MSTEWIYYSKKAPPKSDLYLITVIDPYNNNEVHTYMGLYYDGQWSQYTDEEVLAWSFLPKPAKREV